MARRKDISKLAVEALMRMTGVLALQLLVETSE